MIVEYLQSTLASRSAKNSKYSLRAFADSLRIDSSTLSAIMRRKRPVPIKLARRILGELEVRDFELAEKLYASLINPHKAESLNQTFRELELDYFESISGWEHFAILSLLETADPRKTKQNIASRLNISMAQTVDALSRLARLGLVKETAGEWANTAGNVSTATDIPNAALRRANREGLEKALQSLDLHAIHERDMSGITMAIDPKKIPEAKRRIKKFRRELAAFLESGKKVEVFRLNIQFFPYTKIRRDHEKS